MTMTERLKSNLRDLWVMYVCLLALFGTLFLLCLAIGQAQQDCAAQGGHTVTDTTVVPGNKSVGVGSSSACYSEDGRRLDG